MAHSTPITTTTTTEPTVQLSKSWKPLLSRSYAQRPLGRHPVFKAEFVYASSRPCTSVQIAGDWADWQPQLMSLEQPGLWSIIVLLPTGHHVFRFVVDGQHVLSSRHPVCDGLNWRVVHGPATMGAKPTSMSPFYLWAAGMLERVGIVGAVDDLAGVPTVGGGALGGETRRRMVDCVADLGCTSLIMGVVAAYLVFTTLVKVIW